MGYTLDTRHAPMTSDEPAVKEILYLDLHMPKSLQLALPPPTPRAWQYFSRRNTIAIAGSCSSANATKLSYATQRQKLYLQKYYWHHPQYQ